MLLLNGAKAAQAQVSALPTSTDTLLVRVIETGGIDWPFLVGVASSLATVISVFFAWKAARAAVDAIRDSRAARIEDRETGKLARDEAYYKALVADPALANVMPFVRQAARLVDDAVAEVGALGRTVQVDQIDEIADHTIEEFKGLYLDVRLVLITGATAWGDPELTARLDAALHSLEDSAVLALAALSSRKPEDCRSILQRHGSNVLSIIRAGHPSVAALRIHPISAPVKDAAFQALAEAAMS